MNVYYLFSTIGFYTQHTILTLRDYSKIQYLRWLCLSDVDQSSPRNRIHNL